MADGLIVAAQGLGDDAGGLAPRPGQEELAAASGTGLGGPQALLEGLQCVRSQGTDI